MAADTAPPRRLLLEPCPSAQVGRLQTELGVSAVVAQVLVRRGLGDPAAARAWLDAADRHPPTAFAGIDEALSVIRHHLEAGSKITVHGDYDVDGVCATAILVRALRALGGRVDWYLPARIDDGYGLSLRTVERLAARGTGLLVTVDCAITAVEEVAAARAAGIDVVVTDHHAPRRAADDDEPGPLPDAPIVHPAVCGYPCPELCAAAVAHKLAEALDAPTAAEDLDLAALATVADVVALRGENRRIVREGLRALATTGKPGLRALMRVARVDATRLSERDLGFRLGPRINAAGRLHRADAGLELLLTDDPERAEAVADELDRANAERRHVEQRILFEAEAQVAERGEAAAYVLAGEGWHPGVVGIVASRIAERHHRPAVLIALPGPGAEPDARATGSARSVPAFDLLAGLDACAEHLARHGGHRAAAGLEIEPDRVAAFAEAFAAHAAAVLEPADLVAEVRVDAVVAGGELGLDLAEELERLAPFGHGNPEVNLLVPAARLNDPRPMGEGRHLRCTVETGEVRARAVSFGAGSRLPVDAGRPADLVVALELDRWAGAVEPRLVLRDARACDPEPIEVIGEPQGEAYLDLALDVRAEPPTALRPSPAAIPRALAALDHPPPGVRDRRGLGVAGTVAAAVGSGEPTLVVCADVGLRLAGLRERLGGFALVGWETLAGHPALADGHRHLVLVDPPPHPGDLEPLLVPDGGRTVHLAWGRPEVEFVSGIHGDEHDQRAELAALYRSLRARGEAAGDDLEAALRGDDRSPRPARRAARGLRVLAELGLVEVDREARALRVPPAERTALERSAAFAALERRRREAIAFLGLTATGTAGAAAA